jgi:hypothetical protein
MLLQQKMAKNAAVQKQINLLTMQSMEAAVMADMSQNEIASLQKQWESLCNETSPEPSRVKLVAASLTAKRRELESYNSIQAAINAQLADISPLVFTTAVGNNMADLTRNLQKMSASNSAAATSNMMLTLQSQTRALQQNATALQGGSAAAETDSLKSLMEQFEQAQKIKTMNALGKVPDGTAIASQNHPSMHKEEDPESDVDTKQLEEKLEMLRNK